ncbi:hypothetical protein SK128_003414 [Halocaridina rubra]|uniref:4-coumarate--CoA ligase n=1 Tax=Halocaridina rubra TaxID=373956 RepID=A0AAN9AC66_HALRR
MVVAIRNNLLNAGVAFGDAVLLMSRNHIDLPSVIFGIILSGAICIPVNPVSTEEELLHIIHISKAKWAIVSQEANNTVLTSTGPVTSSALRKIWTMDEILATGSNSARQLEPYQSQSLMADDIDWSQRVALMPFSAGTTGLPKGVMLSHRNILVNLIQIKFLRSVRPQVKTNFYERVLLVLPLYHIYGFNQCMATFFAGGTVFFPSKFSIHGFLRAIDLHKITYAPVTPYVIERVHEYPKLQDYDLSSLVGFATGAAPVSCKTLLSLQKKIDSRIIHGYGLTEASGNGCTTRGSSEVSAASVGPPGPFLQAKVVDTETGRLLGEREEGEICFRGPAVMMGYANNPKATAEIIDSDGWLRTGDIGYYDENNHLYITDRIKDLIKVKGYQVSPTELENVIMKYGNVSDVAVAGVQHRNLGEAPRAWIVPAEGATIDIVNLMKYVADQVVQYKQLAGGVEIVNSIPRNHIGKILRRQLQQSSVPPNSKL